MLLNFFVQGQPHGSVIAKSDDETRFSAAIERVKSSATAVSHMSLDDVVENTKEYAHDKWEASKKLFKFLSGDPVPSAPPSPPPATEQKEPGQESRWKQGLTGLFSGLRPTSTGLGSSSGADEEFTDGEVHADLVMVRVG